MTQTLEHYATEYGRTHENGEPAWLVRTREDALGRFLSRGFPTTRDEEWRFTSVSPIADQRFVLAPESPDASGTASESFSLPVARAVELVFVNGHHAPELSATFALPDGCRVESLGAAIDAAASEVQPYLGRIAAIDGHPFVAFNTAFLRDGALIHVPAKTIVEQPIHVRFLSTGRLKAAPTSNKAAATSNDASAMTHPRVLVVLGASSQATIVVSYAGPQGARYLTNTVSEIVLGENAVLDHYTLQDESVDAYHVGTIHVRAERNASCASHSLSLGGALVRNDVVAVLDGEGVECTLNGLYLADRQRLVDNHTTIDHARPHCGSREIYKGILADRARGVFNGKIIVRPDAQKTDAKQTNRALLLSEDAQINTKPQLEIFANDVRCTHGAAVGQLDDDAVFYMRSRGLAEVDARRMLIHAFASDVLNRMPLAPIRTAVEDAVGRILADR